LAFHSCLTYGVEATVRNLTTYIAARTSYIRKAVHGFRCLSFATEANWINFKRIYGTDGAVCSDQAIESETSTGEERINERKSTSGPLTAIWCGSIDGRKNITMLLDIARLLERRAANVRIAIVGSGKLEAYARRRVRACALNNVQFFGRLPRPEARDLMRRSACILFTSLSEANTATFFEGAEALCIPFALDLDGFAKNISAEYGFKFDPNLPVEEIVEKYASTLEELARSPERQDRMRSDLSKAGKALGWQELARKHSLVLESIFATQGLCSNE